MESLISPKINSKEAESLMSSMVLDLTAIFKVYQDLITEELSGMEGKEKPDVVIQRIVDLIEEGKLE